MISSMTGFASAFGETGLSIEIRSVNHRYLDVQFRLPDELKFAEPIIREKFTRELSRGKVECRVSFSGVQSGEAESRLDAAVLDDIAKLNAAVRKKIPDAASITVSEILAWPGIFGSASLSQEKVQEEISALADIAMADFSATRRREGEKLKAILIERMKEIRKKVDEVRPKMPGLLQAFEEKLTSRLKEALSSVDDERIRHEITLFASRIDVDEELSRLVAHLDEMDRILAKGGVVGKRLDFLMQELNREANTLGSKSVDIEVSRISMEIKVLIEQMREQIQNIE
jgi:uncharacterized protein (TIGR00255 family)